MSTLLQAADGTSLKNKAVFFFALTALLTLIAAVGVLYEYISHAQAEEAGAGLSGYIAVLLAFLFCTLVAAMICFQQQVLIPLAEVNATTRLMIDGHLDTLNRIKKSDEIGRLSENINDLAINMQEVLLFIWNHTQQSCELLDQITDRLDTVSDAEEIIAAIQKDLARMVQDNEDLKAIVMGFSYFEIKLEHEKMLADTHSLQDGSCCAGTTGCGIQ